jgi:hypothetical protein
VDGRKTAPVGRWFIDVYPVQKSDYLQIFTVFHFHSYQELPTGVQDFFHPQYQHWGASKKTS